MNQRLENIMRDLKKGIAFFDFDGEMWQITEGGYKSQSGKKIVSEEEMRKIVEDYLNP